MTRARRGSGPPLSLFSFQDVITSITGIMIMVVLLQILDILGAKAEGVPDPVDLGALEEELGQLQGRAEGLERRVASLPRDTPGQIESDIRGLEGTVEGLEGELTGIEGLIADLLAPGEPDGPDPDGLQLHLVELEEILRKIREEHRVFVTFEHTGKTEIIVQCEEAAIAVKVCGPEPEVLRLPTPADFLRWVATREPARDAIFLFLRPASVRYADEIISELGAPGGDGKRFQYGCEPLLADESVVFDEDPLR